MKKVVLCGASVAFLATVGSGCGGSTFGGNSDRASTPTQPATAAPTVAAANQSLTAVVPANPSPEQAAIGHCIEAWGVNPFGQNAYTNFRKVSAAVTVFGGSGYAVEDTQPTSQPALVVVQAAVSVLGSANFLLMNPNGWYCIMTEVNVLAQAEIDLQCQAHLADSKVQVNVGSSADPSAGVGVNVLSTAKVVRKASATGGGC